MGRKIDLTGKTFSRLLVIEDTYERNKNGHVIWLCKCDCGNITKVESHCLKNGNTQSCGCLHKETITKHGHTSYNNKNSKIYFVWGSMKSRCLDKNHPRYKDYGGRGITICEKWLQFTGFLEDMGIKPRGLSIDRIDNEGNYELSNCKWSTSKQQANNRRDNI